MGLSLLDDMIFRGNRVAQLRKSETELLEEFAQPLHQDLQRNRERQNVHPQDDEGRHLVTPMSPGDYNIVDSSHNMRFNLDAGNVDSTLPSVTVGPTAHDSELLFDWRDLGLSFNQMLSAADQLSTHNMVDADEDGLPSDFWLWSHD